MLHDVLANYLNQIEQALMALEDVYVERYVEEVLTPQRATLRIRVRFSEGQLLEINEAIVVEEDVLMWLDYRYHYQNQGNCLIFRYDSTPHFPGLSSFPHHKHLPDGVIACEKPDITEVLREAIAQ
ncbi:toxin TumE [Spirulina subsalsa]|uniref:toxin TumE n=1 Tax=Spirulina subsalsa TaxID=54311 RepID=UPI0002FE514F|nr:DUF6516 family protein [Spirulina subsalsa]